MKAGRPQGASDFRRDGRIRPRRTAERSGRHVRARCRCLKETISCAACRACCMQDIKEVMYYYRRGGGRIMTGELVAAKSGVLDGAGGAPGLPSLIVRAGGDAERRYLEFFAAQIRNRNTREAYLRAVRDFLDWAETEAGIEDLLDIEPRACRGLGRAQDADLRGPERQAAARGAAPSVRLAGHRPCPAHEPGILRPGAEILLHQGQDADPDADRGPEADPVDPDRYPGRPAGPGADRAHDLHLRAGLGGGDHERQGRVPEAGDPVGAPARERRQAPRDALPA